MHEARLWCKLYEHLRDAQHGSNAMNIAIAILIKTAGATPQKAGAKMLIYPDGRLMGTIGGGCLEAAVKRRALQCIHETCAEIFSVSLDAHVNEEGPICGGLATVYVDAQLNAHLPTISHLIDLLERRLEGVLGISIHKDNGCVKAAWFIVELADQLNCAERWRVHGDDKDICAYIRHAMLAQKKFEDAIRRTLSSECVGVHELQLSENALTTVYLQSVKPAPVLLIAGAGHVGAAVAQIGALVGFEVVVVDDRPSFANRQRLPFASRIIVDNIPHAIKKFPIDTDTYIVIVTRGHVYDAEALSACINSPAKYIGMIGSRRKVKQIFDALLADGIATAERLAQVHAPIGLDIGSVTPEEIAVSIIAELIAVRRGKAK